MDRIAKTVNLVKSLNSYNKGSLDISLLIKEVCAYYDYIKDYEISDSDKIFLYKIANQIGIPHYFDLLSTFKGKEKPLAINNISLDTLSSFLYESTLTVDEDSVFKLHRYQKQVLDLFEKEKENRYFLSASTSFGKTFLVYEIIKKIKYKNILLIFPTIALLSENLERIQEDPSYRYFHENFTIHTLSKIEDEEYSDQNIFLFTPERFLSYLDNNDSIIEFDFAFIDEAYKLDNEYIIDEEMKEDDRDLAYRMALFYIFDYYNSIDALLVGPYISFFNKEENNYNLSFDSFLIDRRIKLINRNKIEIVNKDIFSIKSAKQAPELNNLTFVDKNGINLGHKSDRLNKIIEYLYTLSSKENCIIYHSTKNNVEKTAKSILEGKVIRQFDNTKYKSLIEHISKKYHKDWIVLKALKNGIGIHHGSVPKYIQKEIINLFNRTNNSLFVLVSTTTITEGVNTSAKNLIVLSGKKGLKNLKKFDAKNIIGRAGRFNKHFTGRVIILRNNDFENILNSDDEPIKHKNYDENSIKNDIDIEITNDNFLTQNNIDKRTELLEKQRIRNIPEEYIKQFKVVSREDKIYIYDKIKQLAPSEHNLLKALIKKTNYENPQIEFDGFQLIIDLLFELIKHNSKLNYLFSRSDWNPNNPNPYSRITNKLYWYLKDGFKGAFKFNNEILKHDVDKSMRETADFIYNILKYQLVKYLGVFNVMYKVERSQSLKKDFEEIKGLDRLLIKLEYNAFSKEARIANDYGVPSSIIKYYDSDPKERIKIKFDKYEEEIFKKIQNLI